MRVTHLMFAAGLSLPAAAMAQDATFEFETEPLFKMVAPIETEFAGAERLNVEMLRDAAGNIRNIEITGPNQPNVLAKGCPCVTISLNPLICVTIPCGGGTFSTTDLVVFQEFDFAPQNGKGLRAVALNSGQTIELAIPELMLNATGQVEMMK